MSYQERRAIVSLLTTSLIAVIFFVFVLPRYPTGNAYSASVFHFWGLAVLLLTPVSIVANIVIGIVFSIAYNIATQEKFSSVSDERDRIIELRALRNGLFVFAGGFYLAIGSLALNMTPSVMFIVLMSSGYGAGLVGNITQIALYRRGC